jgi:hypothetical protein
MYAREEVHRIGFMLRTFFQINADSGLCKFVLNCGMIHLAHRRTRKRKETLDYIHTALKRNMFFNVVITVLL